MNTVIRLKKILFRRGQGKEYAQRERKIRQARARRMKERIVGSYTRAQFIKRLARRERKNPVR